MPVTWFLLWVPCLHSKSVSHKKKKSAQPCSISSPLWMTTHISDIPEVAERSKCSSVLILCCWICQLDWQSKGTLQETTCFVRLRKMLTRSKYDRHNNTVTNALPSSLIICFPVEEMSLETPRHMSPTHLQNPVGFHCLLAVSCVEFIGVWPRNLFLIEWNLNDPAHFLYNLMFFMVSNK